MISMVLLQSDNTILLNNNTVGKEQFLDVGGLLNIGRVIAILLLDWWHMETR